MLTRSKTRKLRNFNKIKSSEITMASNGDINGSDEVEFDINNQMGETERIEEVKENKVVVAPLEARGRTQKKHNKYDTTHKRKYRHGHNTTTISRE